MSQEQREVRRKMRVLEFAEKIGNVRKACRHFGIARSVFYLWKKAYIQNVNKFSNLLLS